ncbi:MAG TPA: hypothetical protein VKT70_12885 [Stellaceae bacterium]|nr:hypothetical protein [Stellaceae bacterium]
MKRPVFPWLFIVLPLMVMAPAGADPHDYASYHNTRFGQRVEYPRDLFPIRRPPPENDDGQIFTSQDGESTLSASGRWNIDEFPAIDPVLTEAEAFRIADGWTVTYRKTGKDWCVMSGIKGDHIFYEKLLLTHRKKIINTLTLDYPVAAKPLIDPVIARIAASFREGAAAITRDEDRPR